MTDAPAPKVKFDFAQLLTGLLDPDQIKRVLKYSMRSMSDPCGMPGCTGISPGPACTECTTPLCVGHILFRASSLTKAVCPNCVMTQHLAVLAELGLLDDEEEDEPAPAQRRKQKRRPSKR